VAAASVLAKVTRDRLMGELDAQWPVYDFATHKGYITASHAEALEKHGPSPIHRMRFVNVRRAAGLESEHAPRAPRGAVPGPDDVAEQECG
jgi:ribonuclease HII